MLPIDHCYNISVLMTSVSMKIMYHHYSLLTTYWLPIDVTYHCYIDVTIGYL